ncbi:MAG: Ig-like domain-containing protein, partial [Rhodobacteraceae bacterium]|nr:Ig-like domain-containing protein [Paracoccaceae bacterium]
TLTVSDGSASSTTSFTLTVDPVNDRPVASGSATLAAIAEDTAAPPGALVSALFAANYSDATDSTTATPLAGVAIIANAATAAQGTWQYSANGSTGWTDVPTSGLSDASALVLPASHWLRFVPSANWNGTPGALTARLADGSGGPLTLAASADLTGAFGPTGPWSLATVGLGNSVNAVAEPPVLALNLASAAYVEGQAALVLDSSLTVDDADLLPLASATVAITGGFTSGDILTVASPGSLATSYDAGTGVLNLTGSATIAQYQAALRSVTFVFNGDHPTSLGLMRMLAWTVNDGVFDSAAQTSTIDITPINDAPSGADATLTILEDTPRTLTLADFGFTDTENHAFTGLTLSNLQGAGTLALDGTPVINGQFIHSAAIAAGKLVFTPAPNGFGSNHASFDFQVHDDGGVANGGADTDPTPNTLRFDVTTVNDAPSGADATLTTLEDTPRTLTLA